MHDPKDDPLWKDPLNDPRRAPDPVTDPNVDGAPERPDESDDIERGPLEPDQPTPLSDERR